MHAFLADHRHQLFPPELFTEIARRGGGHPSVPAEVVATVMVLQAATQDSVTQLVAAIRRLRRPVPAARVLQLGAHDDDRPGKPDCAWDDPEATQVPVSGLVNDALAVLSAVGEVEGTPSRPRRWRCWRWWQAKTSSRASGQDRGGSLGACPQDQRAAARRRQGPHRHRTPRLGW